MPEYLRNPYNPLILAVLGNIWATCPKPVMPLRIPVEWGFACIECALGIYVYTKHYFFAVRTQIFYSFVASMNYSTSYGAAEGRQQGCGMYGLYILVSLQTLMPHNKCIK